MPIRGRWPSVKRALRPLYRFARDGAGDAWRAVRRAAGVGRDVPVIYAYGFSRWKRAYLRRYYPGQRWIFLPGTIDEAGFTRRFLPELRFHRQAEIRVWGAELPPFLARFAASCRVPVRYVEDGFLRSAALGATKSLPMSLCVDGRAPYFSARAPSDLEHLLSSHDFDTDPQLELRSRRALQLLLGTGLSKYNHAPPVDVARLYGPKRRRRILVIGQVEDDASILHGCDRPWTNNEAVLLAVAENPDAEVFYKPHPDVLGGHRARRSDPAEVAHLCTVLEGPLPMAQALQTIDHVYTISSLGGFEALLRGLRVTTLGCPFYAGWGLTDDRQPNPRRTRRLRIEQLFAGAYLLYPSYFDPRTGAASSFEQVAAALTAGSAQAAAAPTVLGDVLSALARWRAAARRRLATTGRGMPTMPPGRNALSLYVP